jgi:hypothetical protein
MSSLRAVLKPQFSFREYNINLLQQTKEKMSCFSMMPNCYYQSQTQTPFTMGMPIRQENPSFSGVALLQVLSQALNKSVRNYEQKCLQISSKPDVMELEEVPKQMNLNNSKTNGEMVFGEENFKNSIENKKS